MSNVGAMVPEVGAILGTDASGVLFAVWRMNVWPRVTGSIGPGTKGKEQRFVSRRLIYNNFGILPQPLDA